MLKLLIQGEPASKANSRKLVYFGKRPAFIKSDKARAYEEAALWQLKTQLAEHTLFTGPVGVSATIYYASHRPDLDPSIVLDVMQKAGVYANDRLIEEMRLYKKYDKLNPRAEVTVWDLTTQSSHARLGIT